MSGTVGDNTARASGVVASAGGGAVLQVKSVQVTNTISVGTSATPVAMTAFDIAFTPTAATSVLCLQLSMQAGNPGSGTGGYFYDSTGAAIIPPYADSGGSRQQLTFAQAVYNTTRSEGINYTAWFTPGDATTRTIQVWAATNASSALYINRSNSDNNTGSINDSRQASTFTITEYDGSIVTVA